MSRKDVVNELHKPARKTFQRRRTVVKGIDDLWQADLVEMLPYAEQNKGFKYLLTVIDCFSKYLWVKPLKNKQSKCVTDSMEQIFTNSNRSPKNLQTDGGKEFYNQNFKKIVNEYGINHYSTFSVIKAGIVERVNRTLKEKLWKAFSLNGSFNWIDIIDTIVYQYNHTKHRTIKMSPATVNKRNEKELLETIYKPKYYLCINKYKVGDHVRISKHKLKFDKGYTPNWTSEIFTIRHVNRKCPVTYLLKDYEGCNISGCFYEPELQKVKHENLYLVEKILIKRNSKLFVKWLGFDDSHNSWINKNNLH